MSHLIPFWFIVIAVLWTIFFILEGFDFGVGMLHAVVGRDEAGRRAAINTIGPLWDGNEVWLIVAGAAMFAAFPGWYATMFSAYYLALVLLLASLIVRGLAADRERPSAVDRAGHHADQERDLADGQHHVGRDQPGGLHPAVPDHRHRGPVADAEVLTPAASACASCG